MASVHDFVGDDGPDNVQSLHKPVKVEKDGKGKPTLPPRPARRDLLAQADWLTVVLRLDTAHPITRGTYAGLALGRGHVKLDRLDAPSLHIKPASLLNDGKALNAALVWQLLPTDGELYRWGDNAITIAQVVGWFCDASAKITSDQETRQILTTYLDASDPVEGHTTYGTTGQRYDAAVALRPDKSDGREGRTKYLIDKGGDGGAEFVIRVSDLAKAARGVLGSSIERGWLDGQVEEFGDPNWVRVELQGQSIKGREGRAVGQHTGVDVYRGLVSTLFPNEKGVNA